MSETSPDNAALSEGCQRMPATTSNTISGQPTDDEQSHPQKTVQSCTILTINANTDMQSLHDRMPVILPVEAWDAWLNPSTDKATLQALLKPFEDGHLMRSAVSTIVNRPIVDSPECIICQDTRT